MNFLKKTLNEITDVDKSHLKRIFIYSILFCIAFIFIIQIFGAISGFVSSKITAATGVADISTLDSAALENYSSQASGLLFWFVFTGLIFALVMAYNYSFFENLVWNSIFNKKTNFKNTSRFLGLNVLLAFIFSLILIALFFILSKILSSMPKTGTTIFYFAVLFCIYLFYVSYWAFGKTHEVFKSAKIVYSVGIKRIDLTVLKLVIALVVGILLNLILLLFSWTPSYIYVTLSVAGLLIYFSWFRLYLTNALKSVKL